MIVAAALASDPDILFLDEPTVGLDPIARRVIWGKIRSLVREGKTVVLTTHYMDEAETLSDEVIIIDRGSILAKGKVEDLRKLAPYTYKIEVVGYNDALRSALSTHVYGDKVIAYYDSLEKAMADAEKVISNGASARISPVTLEDVFIRLVDYDET